MIMNLVTSFIITYTLCYVVSAYNIYDGIYLVALIGGYMFTVFAISNLAETGFVTESYHRLALIIFCILVYDIIFVLTVPVLFGADILAGSHTLANSGYYGFGSQIVIDKYFYLAIVGIIVILLNYVYDIDKINE